MAGAPTDVAPEGYDGDAAEDANSGEMLRPADFAEFAKFLRREMGVSTNQELLPLVTGVLSHLCLDDWHARRASRRRRRGAFTSVVGRSPGEEEDDPYAEAEDMWKAMVRSLFSRDAAVCLQAMLLKAYTNDPFLSELAKLRASWKHRDPTPSVMECSLEIDELSFDMVLQRVLPHFGLPVDTDVLEILQPYMSDPLVAALDTEIKDALHGRYSQEDLPLAPLTDYTELDVVEVAAIVDGAMQATRNEGLSAMALYEDSRVQSHVLASLGIGWTTTADQEEIQPDKLLDLMCSGGVDLAKLLMGRNAFDVSLLPLLRRLTALGKWPLPGTERPLDVAGQPTELPTLELCAAVVTRILCVAQRLRQAGGAQLLVLSVGAGRALTEASIALHLAKALGLEVDLQAPMPLTFRYGDNFQILFVVSAASDPTKSRSKQGVVPLVGPQMAILPYATQAAVRDFASHRLPMFVFSSWPPEGPNWTVGIEEAAGSCLQEIFVVRPPPLPDKPPGNSATSRQMRTTELFPKTLSCIDFLAHGDLQGVDPHAFLHHSHVYCYTPWDVPPPFLSERICHTMGPFPQRVKAYRALEGLDVFRRLGFLHMRSPADVRAPLPESVVTALKEMLFSTSDPVWINELRSNVGHAVTYAYGPCRRTLEALLVNTCLLNPAYPIGVFGGPT